jgi:hypothetical protein
MVGTGELIDRLANAIEQPDNNFFVHQIGRFGERKISHYFLYSAKKDEGETTKVERLIYDFYKDQIADEQAFAAFTKCAGKKYALLAYLFYIKDDRRYVPIAPTRFDRVFTKLGINFKTSHRASWENYTEFNHIIESVQEYLQNELDGEVRLIDAHSFLWTLNWVPMGEPRISEPIIAVEIMTSAPNTVLAESWANVEDNYRSDSVNFIRLHRRRMLIGQESEEYVQRSEKNRLIKGGREDLATKVRIVSDNSMLGYDILSFELNGIERQIEVKTVRQSGGFKDFFISRNECEKSKLLPNYYLFFVERKNDKPHAITFVKNPDLSDPCKFEIQPVNFIVRFKRFTDEK